MRDELHDEVHEEAPEKDAVPRPQKGGGTARSRRKAARPAPVAYGDATHVTDAALATLIGLAAHEVPGVVGMAPANLGEGLRRILGGAQANEGVEIHRNDETPDRAEVVLHVVVAYGVNIPVVAESISERVRYIARHDAGVALDDVRVHVAGVSRD